MTALQSAGRHTPLMAGNKGASSSSVERLFFKLEVIMSTRSKRPCRRCNRLTNNSSGLCDGHEAIEQQQRKQYDRERGTAHARGYTATWRKVRQSVLREEPLCRECKKNGILTPATDVHHDDGNPRNNSRVNLIPLCHSCHSKHTSKYQAWGNSHPPMASQ